MKNRVQLKTKLLRLAVLLAAAFGLSLQSRVVKAATASGDPDIAVTAPSTTASTATTGSTTAKDQGVRVVNSHSNLDPQSSIAYVAEPIGADFEAASIKSVPVAESPDKNVMIEPAGLTPEASEEWVAAAKQAATADYLKTGRAQEIKRVAATVATIQIGSSSIPKVSAIDISSYQSWMKAADFSRLKKLGVTGVVIKATEGTGYTNPYAASQYKMVKAAGMVVTFYHFATFTSTKSAGNEGRYFAKVMKSMGVPSSTRVFADMEYSATINTSAVKTNLNAFWSTTKSGGYSTHGVYTSTGYKYTAQMIATVGKGNGWVAQYPYTPSSSSMNWSEYGAWQFSSTARFAGMSSAGSYLDVSHDYKGILSNGPDPTTAKSFNKYVTVNGTSGSIWANFSFEKRAYVKSYNHTTVLAKYIYTDLKNKNTYYSIYNNAGDWIGYINTGYTKVGDGAQGGATAINQYGTVVSKTGKIYSDFGWTQKATGAAYYHQTLHAKIAYYHYNGYVYYSVYDANDKWVGYINAGYLKSSTGKQGGAIALNQYVTVTGDSGNIYSNFSWQKRHNVSDYQNQTLQVKIAYCHYNGFTYYSVYDKDKWVGYINAGYTQAAPGKQGNAVALNQYVTVTSNSGNTYGDFSFNVRKKLKDYTHQTLLAKIAYHHFNGFTYYSVYDKDKHWIGYVNAGYTKAGAGQQGGAIAVKKYVTVTANSGNIFSNFSWTKAHAVTDYYHTTLTAKIAYYHYNGSTYYSVYDGDDRWVGYVNAANVKAGDGKQGGAIAVTKSVKVISKTGYLYSNFNFTKKGNVGSYYGKTLDVKIAYYHLNGFTYYSVYQNNKWVGYINAGYTK